MTQATYVTRSFQRENGQWIMKGYSTQQYSDLVGFLPVAEEKLESDWVSPKGNLRYKVEMPKACPDCSHTNPSITCSTCNGEGLVLSDPNIEGAFVPMSAGWGKHAKTSEVAEIARRGVPNQPEKQTQDTVSPLETIS
ncbi:MAG: hypothetical protein AAFY72_18895 [Cyanobacteria bacterium J06649_4]